MKLIACMAIIISLTFHANAAQVAWDIVDLNFRNESLCAIEFSDHRFWEYQVFCYFVSGPWGQDWSLTADEGISPIGKGGIIMYKAAPGSIVNHDSAQQSEYFVNIHGGHTIVELADVPWTPLKDSDPIYKYDEDVYLAIIMADYYGDEVYGWIHLYEYGVYEKGVILDWGSAIDLDGGPMIVGGGAWEGSTPEPASGLLLLVGGALLAMRRRRNLV